MESEAQDFYKRFNGDIAKNYLKLTQKLSPLRIACAGGHVPIDDGDPAGEGDPEEEQNDGDGAEEADEKGTTPKKRKKEQAYSKFAFTSKLRALVNELENVRTKDETGKGACLVLFIFLPFLVAHSSHIIPSLAAKSLVFSQYSSTLKWLQRELPNHGFSFRTLSGDMTMKQRAKALHDFQHDPPTTVFLLSMRAGAVGINLTQGSNVFLLEPCFNPALQAQAIGRVWRLGQERPVEIIHLVMEDSVEVRIRKMIEKKYGPASAIAMLDDHIADHDDEEEEDKKPAADPSTPSAKADAPLIGSIVSDKALVMKDEFDLLFGVENAGVADTAPVVPDRTPTSSSDF